jgi:hypothetical protein
MLLGAFGAASLAGTAGRAAGAPPRQIQITVAGPEAMTIDYNAVVESLTHLREWLGASFSNTPDGGQP